MARCCGGSGTCACKVVSGRKATVTGTGTSQDPFVVASNIDLSVEDSAVFDLGLSGDGTLESPWILRVAYASSAQLSDIPDVDETAPSNGQVLSWSSSEQKWIPSAPAVATPGGISHDNSMNGDGSVGSVLAVRADSARFLSVNASGVGLNNAGLNQLVRVFADDTARAAASPAPVVNSISLLTSQPGQIDYWDGTEWLPITNGIGLDVQTGEMLALSGSYAGGPVTKYVAQISTTTDVDGELEIVPADDLTDYAGVLSVVVSPIGTVPWVPMLDTDTDRIIATAYRVDDGTPYAGAAVVAVVEALLY